MVQADSSHDYFTEIEAHFAFRRGTPFVLSGKDWALIRSWHEEGIPLAIVLEAVDDAFDSRERSGRKSPISSLSYCRHAVVDLWEERRAQLVGGVGSVPEIDPSGRVTDLASSLRAIGNQHEGKVRESLTRAADALSELASKERSAPATEQRLIEIESDMIESLLASVSDDLRASWTAKVDTALKGYEIADDEALRKTRDANLRRVLRSELKIPRLSLFG